MILYGLGLRWKFLGIELVYAASYPWILGNSINNANSSMSTIFV